jgi:hypothetical protein
VEWVNANQVDRKSRRTQKKRHNITVREKAHNDADKCIRMHNGA